MIPNIKNYQEQLKELQEMIDNHGQDIDYDEIMNELGVNVRGLEEDMKNYTPTVSLGYVKLHVDTVEPKYNYPSDSGFDLHSVEEIIIPPLGRALVPTGISFDINDGHEIQVRSKSGLAINQGLMVLNSPGTVDNGYNGEIKVIVFNTNQTSVTITKGMKVAQAVLCPVINGKWVTLEKKEQTSEKDRGDNGFGSTGI